MDTREETTTELQMDADALYREETFSDQRAGTVRRLTPVTADGDDDPTRPVLYIGQAQMLTPMGAMPLAFEIRAASLAEAVAAFAGEAKAALERTLRELEDMRREAASQIVVPKAGGGLGGPGGLPGAGLPGGGKIHMP